MFSSMCERVGRCVFETDSTIMFGGELRLLQPFEVNIGVNIGVSTCFWV